MTEEWRSIPGFVGRYEVSSLGRVRSLGFYSNNRFGTRTWRAGRVLKAGLNTAGYRCVTLVDGDADHSGHRVHRLVLEAFVGPPPAGKGNGLHRDGDQLNNAPGNLYWGTHLENTEDSISHGTHVQARKATCDLGHLLVAPNLVPCMAAAGNRSCLACKMAMANHLHDNRLRAQGKERTRFNCGKDGFRRRRGESWQDEAHRRYLHIMGKAAFVS